MIKRVYIEIAELEEKELMRNATHAAIAHGLTSPSSPEAFFHNIIGDALSNGDKIWAAILESDEIYMDSALIPQWGVGGGVLFNNFMYRAIQEQITGKKIFFLVQFDTIWWNEMDEELIAQTLDKNPVYTMSEEWDAFILQPLEKILNEF